MSFKKSIHIIDLRNYESGPSIRRAIFETLKKDGYISPKYMLRGCDANRIGEILPQKSTSLHRFSNKSDWYFATPLSFKKDITDIDSPLFHALNSQKPLLAVFDSDFFKLTSANDFLLKDDVNPYSAIVKAYLLKF